MWREMPAQRQPLVTVRCAHEPDRVMAGPDELSVELPESHERVQQVVATCVHCGQVIYGLLVFFRDRPCGRVKWRSHRELTRGLPLARVAP